MSYHARNSLNLLQRIISEGSDSSSGPEQGSGQEEAELGETVENKDVLVNSDQSVSKQAGRVCMMSKMGNAAVQSHETEEELERKYEEFLKGGEQSDARQDSYRDELLQKIEEEEDIDVRPVAGVKTESQHKTHVAKVHHESKEPMISIPVRKAKTESQNVSKVNQETKEAQHVGLVQDETVENNSKVVSEEVSNKKKMKARKKKRRVKKAFVEREEDLVIHDKDEERNQENSEEMRLVKREDSTDQESVSDRHEVMSDLGPLTQNQKKRKLVKRTQIRKFRSLDINPNLFYEDRLQQKYGELKDLVTKGITQQQVSRRHLRQMEMLRQQYASVSQRMPPSGRPALREMSHYQPEKSESENAYRTIRMLQVTNRGRFSRPRPQSAAHVRQEQNNIQSRPKSAAITRHEQSKERPARPSSSKVDSRENNQSLRNRSYSPRNRKQNGGSVSSRSKSADSDMSSEEQSHVFPHSDHQLKNTDNELIKEWLKKKNIVIRRQKAEERKKKRDERKKEQAIAMEKEKRKLESKEKVHEWLSTKRHEAIKKEKEERVHKQYAMEVKEIKESLKVTMVSGQGFHYPPSPPLYKTKHVVRPGTTMADMQSKKEPELPVAGEETPENVKMELNARRLKEEENQQTTVAHKVQVEGPHPPTTKFVYKRPVLGRVRLKVRQQQTPDEQAGEKKAKFNHPVKKDDNKPRKSYDQWLAEKRVYDGDRRKDIMRQKKMTKSDPELERIVPELIHRRIDNTVSKSLNEVDYLEEVTRRVVSEVLSSLEDDEDDDCEEVKTNSHNVLKVSGSKASLSARPKSASSAPVPSLQMSKSPRRPASAKPHFKAVSKTGNQSPNSSYKIPFPPEMGVPKHVEAMQHKLFSSKLWINPEDGERPEPQGCDAVEQIAAMMMEECERDSSASLNDSMKFKRVSFCETATVIEEDIPSTNTETPDSEEQLSSPVDAEKQEKVLSNGIFLTDS